MKQVNSVLDFANGAMTERINYELTKVMENIKNGCWIGKARL